MNLQIPKKSIAPIFTIICAALIIIASITMSLLWTPILTVSSLFYIYGAVLLIVLVVKYAKQNIKMLIAPLVIFAFPFVNSWTFGIVSVYYIIAYLAITALFVLTITGIIKSKLPAIITISALALGAIVLTVILSFTALYGFFVRMLFFISWVVSFVAFCGAYLSLILGLKENPETETVTKKELKPKSVAKRVVLTAVTLGIYSFIWVYEICESFKVLKNDDTDFIGEYLSLCFVPFYGFYWMLTRGEILNVAGENNGVRVENYKILYSILFLVQLSWLAFALLQNDINRFENIYSPTPEIVEEEKVIETVE